MRRIRRKRHHPAAVDDLVAGNLGLDQVLVNRREGSPARQVQRPARGTGRFEAVAWTLLTHAGIIADTGLRVKWSWISILVLTCRPAGDGGGRPRSVHF